MSPKNWTSGEKAPVRGQAQAKSSTKGDMVAADSLALSSEHYEDSGLSPLSSLLAVSPCCKVQSAIDAW
ncbi:hypothetical protein PG996_012616 [Apiospora saccharicola]|uniref:Uncharacterized protein n=1 Tax=Apiospora saccharicola TaxID=335842 RepID=A0ABR1U5I3_9PEZI